ncbi:inlA, partial [Symbiodinium necroappetens]
MGALTVLAFCVLATLLAAERSERHLQVFLGTDADEHHGVHRADTKPGSRTHIEEVAAGSATRLGPAKSECTGPAALRSAFLELGVLAEKLTGDPCSWPGAGCDESECVVKIDLSGRPLSGRVGVLPRELESLRLSNTKVHGNTSALQHLMQLMHLDLNNTQIAGSLEPLAPLTQLRALRLSNTQIAGDLQPLAPLTQLQYLHLHNTQIAGDLQPLAPLTQLQDLNLHSTQIVGDLQPLAPLTKLQRLSLSNTQIAGDLQPLAPLTKLQRVKLSNTQIAGDLQPLASLTQLQELYLPNTQIAGDLQPLAPLTKLQRLSLPNTQIAGDLQPLAPLTQLRYLNLDDTQIVGDLQPLAPLTQLQHLSLSNTQIAGDLQPLAPLTQLRALDLFDTKIAGDLQPLVPLTQLQDLDLDSTQIAGDLQPLAPLTQLQKLHLDETEIAGDLQPLAPLTQLRDLSLSNTQIAGDLQPLAPLTKLWRLSLSSTQITGDLQPLAPLTQLQDLNLHNTQIAGDLQPLAPLIQLQELYLYNTQIAGDLQPLAPLIKLQELHLYNTQIAGDLQPLVPLTQLQYLDLDNTQIAGDLQPLAPLTQLQELRLSDTKIAGDLQPLAPLIQLQELRLYNTQIAGDLQPLDALTQLQYLDLDNTQIAGDLQPLAPLTLLQEMYLYNTQMKDQIGRLTGLPNLAEARLFPLSCGELAHWSISAPRKFTGALLFRGAAAWLSAAGRLTKLATLKLAGSQAEFLPSGKELQELFIEDSSQKLLPALMTLVSDCPLNGPVEDLLMPLAASGQLTRLLAQRANLSGHVPDIDCLKRARVDGQVYDEHCALPLSKSLQELDLSGNKITGADALPVQTYISLANNPPITFATGTLQSALEQNLRLDLGGTAITNMRDVSRLFETGALRMTAQTTSTNATGGYSCHDVTSSSLRMSPHLFWPQGLCGCTAGYEGSGTDCSECANNTFNDAFNSSCRPCPANSTAGKGTASIDGCRCDLGRMINDACQCDNGQALSQLLAKHVDCPVGSTVETAKPKVGYARLVRQASVVFRCLDPAEERCNASGSPDIGCTTGGYEGPLCIACSEGYRSRSRQCTKCDVASDTRVTAAGVATMAAVVAVVAGGIYFWRSRAADSGPADAAPVPQGGPVLLQLFQLWGVLLGTKEVVEALEVVEEYVQWLQMTAKGFRDAMSLECAYGRSAQSLCALASPCIPLLLLALCMPLEAVRHGAGTEPGVSSALKLLTALFIGGGEPLQKHAFRVALPLVKCDAWGGEAAW